MIAKTSPLYLYCLDFVVATVCGNCSSGAGESVGTHNLCRDIVAIGPVLDIDADPTEFVGVFRRGPDAIPNSSRSSSPQSEIPSSSSSSSSSDSRMLFTADDLPEIPPTDDVLEDEETPVDRTSMSTAIVSSHDYTNAFAHLRAIVDQISFEQVQTRFHVDKLKVELSKKFSNLENAFLMASNNQDRVVLAQTNVLCKEMQAQKEALSKELDAMRKEVQDQKAAFVHDMLEFRVESEQNFQSLSAQLSELIAYINRGRDDKKVEISSSHGPQPPDDRSRPGDGGRGRGSRSELSRKRGGSSSSRGFRYWLGGS
ncbi:alpha-amylase [Dorcoceras hygrometricum]|uniref:Alpha-amylase n=1 Tax=Dorcoceras hygrometricum TaxID=472368 RepID=A0A2Z7A637_9LAMI|nr:alpha-amylase [Dorcoceras hygrometricum]